MPDETLRDRALEVLLGDALAEVVDLVFLARDGEVEAHSRDGSVAFTAAGFWLKRRGWYEPAMRPVHPVVASRVGGFGVRALRVLRSVGRPAPTP